MKLKSQLFVCIKTCENNHRLQQIRDLISLTARREKSVYNSRFLAFHEIDSASQACLERIMNPSVNSCQTKLHGHSTEHVQADWPRRRVLLCTNSFGQ